MLYTLNTSDRCRQSYLGSLTVNFDVNMDIPRDSNWYSGIVMHLILHTYHSRFIPEGVAEASHIFLQDAYVLPKLFSYK
jgi:hypothetical protein